MKRQIVCLLVVLLFATIGYTEPPDEEPPRGRHIPKTFIHENSAELLLKKNGFKAKSTEPAKCPSESGVSEVDMGGQELGKHGRDIPGYVTHYHQGLEDKKSRIEIWDTVVEGVTARVKYCYYQDPENDYILIYLEAKQDQTTN